MLFTGGTGVGKTHLVAAVANFRKELGKSVFFTTVAELLDHMRHTFAPNSDINYDELFDLVKNTDLLILDDFGSQGSTAWAQEKLYHLLVHRYNSQLSTMLTMEKDEVIKDPKIASRISDPRFVTVVEIEAPDYRTKENSISINSRSDIKNNRSSRVNKGYKRMEN
jgi:DNA replication protein DnaC